MLYKKQLCYQKNLFNALLYHLLYFFTILGSNSYTETHKACGRENRS